MSNYRHPLSAISAEECVSDAEVAGLDQVHPDYAAGLGKVGVFPQNLRYR